MTAEPAASASADAFAATTRQLAKMLRNLSRWLVAARDHAEERGFDADKWLDSRLAVDQFPLVRQVRAACDNAKGTVARMAGQVPPRHADDETELDQLLARIDKVVAYLDGFSAADFADLDDRMVPLFFAKGMGSPAPDYAREFGIPNFYHHVNMAYAILRAGGVKLGKREYIGGMTTVELPTPEVES